MLLKFCWFRMGTLRLKIFQRAGGRADRQPAQRVLLIVSSRQHTTMMNARPALILVFVFMSILLICFELRLTQRQSACHAFNLGEIHGKVYGIRLIQESQAGGNMDSAIRSDIEKYPNG
jgi:hypothetical protein